MDEAGRAQIHEQAALQDALARRKPEAPSATGRCLYCDEPTELRFCDSDCREDYIRLSAKQENDRIMRGVA